MLAEITILRMQFKKGYTIKLYWNQLVIFYTKKFVIVLIRIYNMNCAHCIYCSSSPPIMEDDEEIYYCHVVPDNVQECPSGFYCIEFESEDFMEV